MEIYLVKTIIGDYEDSSYILGAFRDPQEAQEYIAMLNKVDDKEVARLLSKHAEKTSDFRALVAYVFQHLNDLSNFEIVPIEMGSFHLQEKLTETIRIKIHA